MTAWGPVFTELWLTRRRDLLAYGSMLTGNLAEAEDLLHDAVVTTFGKRAQFTHVAPAEAYVRRAMASRFIDAKRSQRSRLAALVRLGTSQESVLASPDLEVENSTDVSRALEQLTPRQRACVVLRYLNGLSTAETAATLRISEGSVKRYLSDALAVLNGLLGINEEANDLATVTPRKGSAS